MTPGAGLVFRTDGKPTTDATLPLVQITVFVLLLLLQISLLSCLIEDDSFNSWTSLDNYEARISLFLIRISFSKAPSKHG